jgi:hypothetical protein
MRNRDVKQRHILGNSRVAEQSHIQAGGSEEQMSRLAARI